MPAFIVVGGFLAVVTFFMIITHIIWYGTKRDMFWLFVYAWLVVFVLWWWQL